MTDARKIRLLRAAIRRALDYVPVPLVPVLLNILDLTS